MTAVAARRIGRDRGPSRGGIVVLSAAAKTSITAVQSDVDFVKSLDLVSTPPVTLACRTIRWSDALGADLQAPHGGCRRRIQGRPERSVTESVVCDGWIDSLACTHRDHRLRHALALPNAKVFEIARVLTGRCSVLRAADG